MMKAEKKLNDFKALDKDIKKLEQVKGGGGGLLTGAKVPSGT